MVYYLVLHNRCTCMHFLKDSHARRHECVLTWRSLKGPSHYASCDQTVSHVTISRSDDTERRCSCSQISLSVGNPPPRKACAYRRFSLASLTQDTDIHTTLPYLVP